MMMHTMKPLPDESGWSVGYYLDLDTELKWLEICQFKETLDAVNRVNLLNGGPGFIPSSISLKLDNIEAIMSRIDQKIEHPLPQ